MPYIGKAPSSAQFKSLDSITVVNGQSDYALTYSGDTYKVATAEQLIVSVNGVVQAPQASYQVDGATLQFTDPLVTGDIIDFVVALGEVGNTTTPVDGSVTADKLSTTVAKDALIRVNDTALNTDVTIASDENAMVAGPFTLNATLTVNGTFTVV